MARSSSDLPDEQVRLLPPAYRLNWLRMLASLILSSAASIAAFDRMIDSTVSPSNGRRKSFFVAGSL
jgi:hypothetical protein